MIMILALQNKNSSICYIYILNSTNNLMKNDYSIKHTKF